MNKQSFFAIAAVLSAATLIYFLGLNNDSVATSEYELLALADHEKISTGNYSVRTSGQNHEGILTFKAVSKTSNSSSRNAIAPAINAVPIAKFLNGNLPTTTPAGSAAPALLSQTGAFSDVLGLEPAPGLIPYDMIEPFWSDGATKTRWMAIPNDGTHDTPNEQIEYSQNNAWDFPQGAVLIKHFELGGKRLETRFEVKGDDNVYYYLTYKWNADQTDATLLDAALDEDVLVNGVTQSWHYPSRNECTSCHNAQIGSVLGPKTRHLNKAFIYPNGIEMNQLVNFSEMGILTQNITNENVENYPAVFAKDDLTASLEDRARSYLDVNCVSCHDPRLDDIATFDSRYNIPLEDQNFIYGTVTYDEGLNDPRVVVPQDISRSMLHFRMNSTQTGIEMPPIGKDVIDTEGVQLIADWINSLTVPNSAAPQAAFSASTTIGVAPLAVNFDASASSDADGDSLTYIWDFGDNTSAEGISVNHSYTSAGSYTVILTVSDGQSDDQATTSITVEESTTPPSDTGAVAFSDATGLIQEDNFSGLAMAIVDMNNDGKDDIVQFNNAKSLRVQYQNGAGQNFTAFNFGQVSNQNQWSTAIADVDQNGFNDILCGGAYDNMRVITNNNGTNSYTQQTLANSNIFIQGSNFVDINNDGWADIFACHDDAESRAFENNQNGAFTYNAELIRTRTNPQSDNSGNYASMWIDYDNDQDLDLYISKCRGGVNNPEDPRRINMLWQNDGNNNFTEVAAAANLQIKDQTWLSDFGDIDNDGDLDAIVINHGSGPNLMRNNGDGTFTEVTAGSGLLPTLDPTNYYGIQGFFKDFNNDGFLDLMVSGDAHYIFYNKGDGTFENAPNPFNSNQIQSFTVGDLNHDGFLDIYAGYANGLNSPSTTKDRIWLNQANSNNFINIQLTGTQSNRNGIGARVELYGVWGIQIRDVKSGEGYGLNNTYTQHFGIGSTDQIDRVVVRWPSGSVSEISNPSSNQFLNITEEENCPDTDGDGVCDADDSCEGSNDSADADEDGVPDGCDICEGGDDSLDVDEDGIPDFCDTSCTDTDEDGVCNDEDLCEGSDDTIDTDADGVPDGCDSCEGNDDAVDTDADGVPDGCDSCEGNDDAVDTDSDGVPDGCDSCEGNNDAVDTDADGVPDGCDICASGDDNIDANNNGVPDACEETNECPSINFNDYNLISYANQDNGPVTIQDGGTGIFMTGNAWKAMEINYTFTANTVLKFEFKSTAEGEIHEVSLDKDNSFGPNVRIVPFGNQGYNGNLAVERYPGDESWKSYTIQIGQRTTGLYKYLVLTADDDVDGSGNSFFRNLSIFEDANANGISDACEGYTCTDSDNDGVCNEFDICQGGDDRIDSDGDGIPDFCDDSSACSNVNLTITFDNYAPEVSWQLNDANGQTVLAGNGYTRANNNTSISENICLPDGCYNFVINDSYGDGICCAYGRGSYSITDASGTVLASGGEYNYSETTSICLGENTTGLRTTIEETSSSLVLSPVPADEVLNLNYYFASGSVGRVSVSIYDSAYKNVYQNVISKDTFSKQIDVSQFSEGVYLIQLSNEREVLSKRFIVKH